MTYTKIAIAKPFEGAPHINLPGIYGASPNKPVILRIPVTGQRPITYGAGNLPEGLKLENGIITGAVSTPGMYSVTFSAENTLGKDEKTVVFEIAENHILLTPLLGFTSWNAFYSTVTQQDIETSTQLLVQTGISEYGYSYINTDSGWQEAYGGPFDAIMPNFKFPDMQKMCDFIHSFGLKAGIYSTPMLKSWGCPKEFSSIPGCTQGEPDELFSDTMGGIGTIRKEKNNAKQWAQWGFDYLKYDWRPSDPYNAELMRKELVATPRDFGYCVSLAAVPGYTNYWSKYCSSYRNGVDTDGTWDNFLQVMSSYPFDGNAIKKGHFYDVDMLDIGTYDLFKCQYTEDEKVAVYSYHAFMGSPVQISCRLDKLTEFEFSIFCNEEVIAINQDIAFDSPKPMLTIQQDQKCLHAYRRMLHDGSYAVMLLNAGDIPEAVNIPLEERSSIRDVWKKKDLPDTDVLADKIMPHTAKIFKLKAL